MDVASALLVNTINLREFVHLFILSRIRYSKLISELQVNRSLVRRMSALNEKIDSRARGSGATPMKMSTYVMYGLGLAISYI